jgi:hypothetical protein
MATSYKPYSPVNYPSGEKSFDLYTVDLQNIMGLGGGPGLQVRFSNPIILMSIYSFYLNRYLSMDEIFTQWFMVGAGSWLTQGPTNPSGILVQQQTTAGANGYTRLGTSLTNKFMGSFMMQNAPLFTPNLPIWADDLQEYRARTYPQMMQNLLNDFADFDSIAIPAETPIVLDDVPVAPNYSIVATMAIKRGGNQPFVTTTPP